MQAGHPFEQMAVLGLIAGQHANDDVDDLGHQINPAQSVEGPAWHEARQGMRQSKKGQPKGPKNWGQ